MVEPTLDPTDPTNPFSPYYGDPWAFGPPNGTHGSRWSLSGLISGSGYLVTNPTWRPPPGANLSWMNPNSPYMQSIIAMGIDPATLPWDVWRAWQTGDPIPYYPTPRLLSTTTSGSRNPVTGQELGDLDRRLQRLSALLSGDAALGASLVLDEIVLGPLNSDRDKILALRQVEDKLNEIIRRLRPEEENA